MAAPRALISVFDKTGLEDLTAGLAARGWEFVASGGTANAIAAAGHPVRPVEDVTGAPEMLDGRVKTLHPAIHGGILARRSSDRHLAELADLDIGTIDLVAVNLYPFAATLAATDNRAELLENIDIGGVALIRAAAKNPDDVWILVDPADYSRVLEAMDHTKSADALRRELAAKAFALTAFYDAHIAAYMQQDLGQSFPDLLTVPLRRLLNLRYGENPHQPGAFYAAGAAELGQSELSGVEQLHGLELSYINILDLQAAWASANDFDDIAVSIIKHTMPCCLAVHPSPRPRLTGEHARETRSPPSAASSASTARSRSRPWRPCAATSTTWSSPPTTNPPPSAGCAGARTCASCAGPRPQRAHPSTSKPPTSGAWIAAIWFRPPTAPPTPALSCA